MTSKQTFKNLAKATVLALCVLLSVNSLADNMFVDINLHAHHWNRVDVAKHNLNEINPGIGLRLVDGNYHKMVGIYKNSDRKTSAYALLAWTPVKISGVRIGAMSGIVSGYELPYQFAGGVYAVIPLTKKSSLNITAVPTIRSIKCYGFAGFQLSIKF